MKRNSFSKLLLTGLILLFVTGNSPSALQQHIVDEPTLPVGSVPSIPASSHLAYTPNYPIHFIGDSRTVGMQQALTYHQYDLTNHSFTARIGKGYAWLSGQNELKTLPPSILIINLGVNDLGNLSRYQALYEAYAKDYWKNCHIYIVSVNPCCQPCTSVSNGQIEAFNASMEEWIEAYNEKNASASTETFPICYIDTYHLLLSEGYSSSDGLHYSAATYERIYNYIIEHIEEPIGDGTGIYTVSS